MNVKARLARLEESAGGQFLTIDDLLACHFQKTPLPNKPVSPSLDALLERVLEKAGSEIPPRLITGIEAA